VEKRKYLSLQYDPAPGPALLRQAELTRAGRGDSRTAGVPPAPSCRTGNPRAGAVPRFSRSPARACILSLCVAVLWRASTDRRFVMRQVVIYSGEDGYLVAECPSLPGCVSQGKTREDAIVNIREAIQAYESALREDHLSVPEDRFDAMLVAV
jgi:predicted RNase H-like HicB family nuclease